MEFADLDGDDNSKDNITHVCLISEDLHKKLP